MPAMFRLLCLLLFILLLTEHAPPDEPSAHAQTPASLSVIFSNIPGHPSADVPGVGGYDFLPGTSLAIFDRPTSSPDGIHWALRTTISNGSQEKEALIQGSGPAPNGAQAVAVSGSFAPFSNGDDYQRFASRLGVADDGALVFIAHTDGDPAADGYVLRREGSSVSVLAQEGNPAPAPPGGSFGGLLHSANLLVNEAAGFVSLNTGGLPVGQDKVVYHQVARPASGLALLQSGASIPAGQVGTQTLADIAWGGYYHARSGTRYLLHGYLNGSPASDEVIILDGAVVAQEGVTLPGQSSPVAAVGGVYLSPSGQDWMARGSNSDGHDWLLANGQAIAQRGQAIIPGSGESWSDATYAPTFFAHATGLYGDVVVGGVTDAPAEQNAVLVLNNEFVIAREGDPVDLDGDGQADDDLYISAFQTDSLQISSVGTVYTVIVLRDGAGDPAGMAFVGLDVTGQLQQVDYGDAPNIYQTARASNGARHDLSPELVLGQRVDPEADGQPSPSASADDGNGLDDEDGVAFPDRFVVGKSAQIQVTVRGAGLVNGWLDWNQDGDFDDTVDGVPEHILDDVFLSDETAAFNLNIPGNGIPTGVTYARFRLASTGGLGPAGAAEDGEVEDYRVFISPVFGEEVNAPIVLAVTTTCEQLRVEYLAQGGPEAALGYGFFVYRDIPGDEDELLGEWQAHAEPAGERYEIALPLSRRFQPGTRLYLVVPNADGDLITPPQACAG